MDKATLAEKALEPAVGPAQAPEVVGDLLEAGARRSAGWFWSNVARTFAGAVWGDLRARPFFYASVAARSALPLGLAFVVIGHTRGWALRLARTLFVHSPFFGHHPKEWLWPALQIAAALATFAAGRGIARRSGGKDAVACAAMALVFPFVCYGCNAVWVACSSGFGALPLPDFGRFWYHPQDAGLILAFLLGVAFLRRRPRLA